MGPDSKRVTHGQADRAPQTAAGSAIRQSEPPGATEGTTLGLGEPEATAEAGHAAARLDDVAVDRHGEIPLGTQLVWALRTRICDRRLAPGQRLPGVRELAATFEINANTARAIYQRLEREGLIESKQGTGTFVAQSAERRSGLGELAADTARRARELGVDQRELASALYVSAAPARATGDESGRRRQLRDQIAALEQAVLELEAGNPGLLALPAPARSVTGPRLLRAEELEDVRAQLMRRLSEAQLVLDAGREPAVERRPQRDPAATSSSKRLTYKSSKRSAGARPTTRPSTA